MPRPTASIITWISTTGFSSSGPRPDSTRMNSASPIAAPGSRRLTTCSASFVTRGAGSGRWTGVKDRLPSGAYRDFQRNTQFETFVAREAVRFLKQFGSRQPFFLVASFLKPHDPFMPIERFARLFRPDDMRLPETWGKVDLASAPAEVRRAIERNGPTPELSSSE